MTSSSFGGWRGPKWQIASLTPMEKIPNWPVKTTFLGEVETAVGLDISLGTQQKWCILGYSFLFNIPNLDWLKISFPGAPGLLSSLGIRLLISAQGVVSGLWDWALCWVWSLLRILAPPFSLSLKEKTKELNVQPLSMAALIFFF